MFCFFFCCNFYQETSYLLGNVYMCTSRRESYLGIYQENWIGSSLASASALASPMLPPCYYYLLVTSFSSSSSSSSSSTILPLSSSEYKHLVSCSCLGKRTKKMTG